MSKYSHSFIVRGAVIAALYVVLTELSALFGLASGAVQIRMSEALCVLAVFTPAAVPGLTVGCLVANVLSGCLLWDVLFGTLATLVGVTLTYMFRKKRFWGLVFPIISNILVLPLVLKYAYGIPGNIWYLFATVGVGEVVSCGICGYFLGVFLDKYKKILFS